MVAHYAQHRTNGKESRSIDEAMRTALRDGDDPVNPYVCMSSYATQVEQYLEFFPMDRILVIDNAEMKADRRAVLREAFGFLGVDEDYDSPRFDEVLNTKRDQVRFSAAGAAQGFEARPFRQARVPRQVRGPITKPLTRLLSESVERPELSDSVRRTCARPWRPRPTAYGSYRQAVRELVGLMSIAGQDGSWRGRSAGSAPRPPARALPAPALPLVREGLDPPPAGLGRRGRPRLDRRAGTDPPRHVARRREGGLEPAGARHADWRRRRDQARTARSAPPSRSSSRTTW